MMSGGRAVENDFMKYLSERVSPAQLSELYRYYSEIEAFCLKIKVLKKPLFETTDFEIIKKVQRTIEQNKIFRITHRRQIKEIVEAGRHYYNFIKAGLYMDIADEKGAEGQNATQQEMSNECPPNVNITEEVTSVAAYTKTSQDERLLQRHPIVYNQIYNALKAFPEKQRVTIREMCDIINHTARPAVVEEILDNVSWASNIGDAYFFSEDIPAIALCTSNTEISNRDKTALKIDFNADLDLAYTRPEGLSYFGEERVCDESWTSLYVAVMGDVLEDYPHMFKPKMSFSQAQRRIDLASIDDYAFMIAPKPIPGTEYVLETNLNANDIVTKIRYILDLCNVDYENIVITYRKKSTGTLHSRITRKIHYK